MTVSPESIGDDNTKSFDDNVYVIAHGWMPGYDTWVNGYLSADNLPLSWDTWQGSQTAYAPSTTWLYQSNKTVDPEFTINPTGLAQEILSVDPHATVLAYSWIDDSATPTNINPKQPAAIPEHGWKSEGYTTMNGLRMAEAITEALAPGYSGGLGKVHLMGHSHGARVATVAALALQTAAATNPQDAVVRQLTLFDSPEDDGHAAGSTHINPIYSEDTANYDWFYLSQLKTAPRPVALSGMAVNGQSTVTGLDTSALADGMGVTGPGIPAGTTIKTIDQGGNNQVELSAAVNVASAHEGSPVNLELGFWNWSGNAIFVDNYVSYFDQNLGNFKVTLPTSQAPTKALAKRRAKGSETNPMANIVDVDLDTSAVFHGGLLDNPEKHQYSANWYAGSATTQAKEGQYGLMWSPFIVSSASLPYAGGDHTWAHTWTKPGSDHQDVKFGTQYFLKKKPAESTITPDFFNAPVTEDSGNCCPGVTIQGNPDNVTAMTLTDVSYSVPMPVFNGEVKHVNSAMGFSFNYSFTGGCTDGAQLQIYFDGYASPYFAMTGSVATSDDLPGSGSLSATFGMGTEYNGWKTLQVVR